MPPKPELLDILICDDVRREQDERFSFMGVYPGLEIQTKQLPTVFSQLAFVMRFRRIPPQGAELHVKIVAPDDQDGRPVQGVLMKPMTEAGEATFVVMAAPLQVTKLGEHTIKIRIGDKLFERKLNVVQP